MLLPNLRTPFDYVSRWAKGHPVPTIVIILLTVAGVVGDLRDLVAISQWLGPQASAFGQSDYFPWFMLIVNLFVIFLLIIGAESRDKAAREAQAKGLDEVINRIGSRVDTHIELVTLLLRHVVLHQELRVLQSKSKDFDVRFADSYSEYRIPSPSALTERVRKDRDSLNLLFKHLPKEKIASADEVKLAQEISGADLDGVNVPQYLPAGAEEGDIQNIKRVLVLQKRYKSLLKRKVENLEQEAIMVSKEIISRGGRAEGG